MTDPTPLSPAAQAVRDAVLATYADSIPKDDNLWALERASTVAALRAAADQVAPKCEPPCFVGAVEAADWFARDDVRDDLLRIATELENQ